jgi:hypothetical protein
MNQRIKTKWINSLRSGEYKQGTGRLRRDDEKFCCLGVLCDLYAKENNLSWQHLSGGYGIDGAVGWIPVAVRNWSGIRVYQEDKLIKMNDNRKTFDEISTYIEENI